MVLIWFYSLLNLEMFLYSKSPKPMFGEDQHTKAESAWKIQEGNSPVLWT